jgi:lauroyl/myristoyl acyltransferase
VKGTVTPEIPQATPIAAPAAPESRVRAAAASFWLNILFWHAYHAPAVIKWTKGIGLFFALRFSEVIRVATLANARRIFGPEVTPEQCRAYGKKVASSFYDSVYDLGASLRVTPERLAGRIESVEGHERYLAARALRKGAIIATAHLGSFETGLAALLRHEPRIHVVFKRDPIGSFEQLRSALRRHLGVIEAPIDDGWSLWLRLREALQQDEVVMVQADRVMPRQKGCRVPFLHGHVLLPTGPIKLAIAAGAPIIPVFAVLGAGRRIRICIEDPIFVSESQDSPHPALLQLARVLEKYVSSYPEQWLLFHKAFCEDTDAEPEEGAA